MAQQYGTVKVDNITFTSGAGGSETDITLVVSGLNGVSNSGITVTGTISGETAEFVSGVFTTQISGATITGDAGEFTSGTFVTATGTTAEFTSGVFTSLSGTTATVTSGVFASGTAAAPSVSVGTTDNGLYSPGTDEVALATNGAQALYINSDGDILVADGNRMEIDEIRARDGAGLKLFDDAGAGIFIEDGGNVGVGTSDPSSLLHVEGSSTFKAGTGNATLNIISSANATDAGNKIAFFGANRQDADEEMAYIKPLLTSNSGGSGNTQQGHLTFGTSGDERLRIESDGNVGIGTTSPSSLLHLVPSVGDGIQIASNGKITRETEGLRITGSSTINNISFVTAGSEAMRVDTSGRLLVGTSSTPPDIDGDEGNVYVAGNEITRSSIEIVNTRSAGGSGRQTFSPQVLFGRSRSNNNGALGAVVTDNDYLGRLRFAGDDGTQLITAAEIFVQVDGTPGANDMPGRLVFSTTADGASSPTERFRVTADGSIYFHSTSLPGAGTATTGVGISAGDALSVQRTAATACFFGRSNDGEVVALYSGTTQRGTISIAGATTTYGSISDHRLKENVAPIGNATSRLAQLKPSRFNFVEFPEQEVDGFIAHEVQTVVPEAVIGTKDATGENGEPLYQSVDQSKLVPLLTAALQEAIGEIESLKARLTAAGI